MARLLFNIPPKNTLAHRVRPGTAEKSVSLAIYPVKLNARLESAILDALCKAKVAESSVGAGKWPIAVRQAGVVEVTRRDGALQTGSGRGPGGILSPSPCFARLGVDEDQQARALGAGLLVDAITRLLGSSDAIGCRGLLIHAESEVARAFYLHLIPELMSSPTHDLHLVLLLKDAGRTLLRAPR